MKKLVIIGGSRGLGFAILNKLHAQYKEVVVLDVVEPINKFENVEFFQCDLSKDCTPCYQHLENTDTLILTAGLGSVKPFIDYSKKEIEKILRINQESIIKILHEFFPHLLSKENKKCLVMGSIAGEVSSPLFSVYGASKAGLIKICESLNIELEKSGSKNVITCIDAVSFKGSSFTGKETNLEMLDSIANECLEAMNNKETKHFIDKELCQDIISRYLADAHQFGLSSYDYKVNNNRIENRKNIIIGYLSGTFDLFHIGHLNLLKRAKEQCDYLIVGVHESGSWKGKETFIPFKERLEIVRACKYVDEAHVSLDEDSDAWDLYHYDKLFVGSDYKGTERFARYEKYFEDKGVKIVYFPYTQGTSSTQLREKLSKK